MSKKVLDKLVVKVDPLVIAYVGITIVAVVVIVVGAT